MRIGISLASYVYNAEREATTTRSLRSLAGTSTIGLTTPVLQIVYKPSSFDYSPLVARLEDNFKVTMKDDVVFGHGTFDYFTSRSINNIIAEHPDVTHVIYLPDDFIYNASWMHQLVELINRHPTDTMAWAVYRSKYTRHHRIIGGDGVDVLMSCHDAMGCVAVPVWQEYITAHPGDYTTPGEVGGGCTIDTHFPYARPGNRWATSRDFMQNLCRHSGIEDQDCAIDFVGEYA